jgi:hypothetical protein
LPLARGREPKHFRKAKRGAARGVGISMKIRSVLAALAVALTMAAPIDAVAQTGPALPPLPWPVLQKLHANPAAWNEFRAAHQAAAPAAVRQKAPTGPPAWEPLVNLPPDGVTASNPLLLTDGTVLVHASCTRDWYRLTPGIGGSYLNGTWSQIASMPSGYSPRFFSSAVLPDGRVIVMGGEYNGTGCNDVETKKGAIYDPVLDEWTSVSAPPGWTTIGDASGIVLSNGTFLLSNCCTKQLATLNPTTLAWTRTGTGKFDVNNEENWTLLAGGAILTVDAYVGLSTCGKNSEKFVPASGQWVSAGSTVDLLSGCSGSVQNFEAPTQMLMPGAIVAAFGATASKPSQNLPVHTALYNATTQTWSAGPNMPKVDGIHYTMADAPAATLRDGTVLIAASPGTWQNDGSYPSPTHFFIFNGTSFTQIGDPADADELSSFEFNFLMLPTGEVLAVETDLPGIELLPAQCCAQAAWLPVITSISSKTVAQGQTYTVSGKQFAGLDSGASYGDDEQASTNYPLVRITNNATGHVFYARTSGFTSVSVARNAASSTSFTVADATEPGASTLEVVANGIASQPKAVTVTITLTVEH